MQTFLPYPDFRKSAQCLDNKRLGKQRVEAWQIYKACILENYGWKNHPIVKMWKGYEHALLFYGYEMCNEWIKRGFKDTLLSKFTNELGFYTTKRLNYPDWIFKKDFTTSHRSNLLRKDSKHYSQFNWKEPNNLPYVWIID